MEVVEICKMRAADADMLFNLYQLYCYDNSAWNNEDVLTDGRFDVCDQYISDYIHNDKKKAWAIYCGGSVAGFALSEFVVIEGSEIEEFADLFVVKKFRQQGVAEFVLRKLILNGKYLISVFKLDKDAAAFWRKMFVRLPFSSVRHWPDPEMPEFDFYIVGEAKLSSAY